MNKKKIARGMAKQLRVKVFTDEEIHYVDKDFIQVSGATRLCSDEFAQKFLDLGFKKADGVFTDVNVFKPNAEWINMANISIGYYNPHTNNEYLDTVAFEKIVNKVAEFISKDYTFEDDKPDEKPDVGDYWASKRCQNCGASAPLGDGWKWNKYGERFCSKECMEDFGIDDWEYTVR